MSHVANDDQFEKKGWSGWVDWSPLSRVDHYFLINSLTSTTIRSKLDNFHNIISPQAMFCVHCPVFHIAVCCCSFSSLFDIVLSEGEGAARSGGKEELGEQQNKAKCKKATQAQYLYSVYSLHSFHEADWGGWSWLKSIDDVFHYFSSLSFMCSCTIILELKDVPGM